MYYKSGIYKHTSENMNTPWVKVDHAVLMIGWGEEVSKEKDPVTKLEKKTPYWVVQNSWGSDWGENGTIRMIRGENESGVEFQAVSAILEDGSVADVMSYV